MGNPYEKFYLVILTAMFLFSCAGTSAFGKEIYDSDKSQKKVKNAMQTLQDGLDDLEDAIMTDNINKAVKLAHQIDEACHYVCNLDLSRSKLSKGEQKEFERLRKSLHYRVDSMTLAADEGLTTVVLDESYKVREACDSCHQTFKKKK